MTILTHDLASASNDQHMVSMDIPVAKVKPSVIAQAEFNDFIQTRQNKDHHRHRGTSKHVKREAHKNHVPFEHLGSMNCLEFFLREVRFGTGRRHNSTHLYFTPAMFERNGNLLRRASLTLNIPKNSTNGIEYKQQVMELDRIEMVMCCFASVGTKCIDVSNRVQHDKNLNFAIWHKVMQAFTGDKVQLVIDETTDILARQFLKKTMHTTENQKLVIESAVLDARSGSYTRLGSNFTPMGLYKADETSGDILDEDNPNNAPYAAVKDADGNITHYTNDTILDSGGQKRVLSAEEVQQKVFDYNVAEIQRIGIEASVRAAAAEVRKDPEITVARLLTGTKEVALQSIENSKATDEEKEVAMRTLDGPLLAKLNTEYSRLKTVAGMQGRRGASAPPEPPQRAPSVIPPGPGGLNRSNTRPPVGMVIPGTQNAPHYTPETGADPHDRMKKHFLAEASNVLDVAVYKSTVLLLRLRKLYDFCMSLGRDGGEEPFSSFINSSGHEHEELLRKLEKAYAAAHKEVSSTYNVNHVKFSSEHAVLEESIYDLLIQGIVDLNNHAIDLLAMFCDAIHKPEIFEALALEYRAVVTSFMSGVQDVTVVDVNSLKKIWNVFTHVANLCDGEHKNGSKTQSYEVNVLENIGGLLKGNMGTKQTAFMDIMTDKKLWKDEKLQTEAKKYLRSAMCPLAFDGLNEHIKKSFPKKSHTVTVHRQEKRQYADLVAAMLKRLDMKRYVMELSENHDIRMVLSDGSDILDIVNHLMTNPVQVTKLLDLTSSMGICHAFGSLETPFQINTAVAPTGLDSVAVDYENKVHGLYHNYKLLSDKKKEGPLSDEEKENLNTIIVDMRKHIEKDIPGINSKDMCSFVPAGENNVYGCARRFVLKCLTQDACHKYVQRRFTTKAEEDAIRRNPNSSNIKAFQWFIEWIHPQIYCAFIPDEVKGIVAATHRYHGFNQLGNQQSDSVIDLRVLQNFVETGTVNAAHKLHIGMQYYYRKYTTKFGKVIRQRDSAHYAGTTTHKSIVEAVPDTDLCPDWDGTPVESHNEPDKHVKAAREYHRDRKKTIGKSRKPHEPNDKHNGKKENHGDAHKGKKHQKPASTPHHGAAHHHDGPVSSRTRSKTHK